ncbi:ankyrin repeat-containing domain protein [Coprinopsis sp. MPI-PUGE-AT-0042]|nr:ankyrin repeat-containing domain protein [Coprinopsis sp. MPI-PUGE-AT-0042]
MPVIELIFDRSIVIRYLEGLESTSRGVICVAYVYLRYSEPLAIREILESLVKQIVERHTDLIPSIEPLYARHQQERTKPSQQELTGVLEGFVVCGKTLFFVLDALDEMRVEDRPILLRLLASLDAKIFITSRPLEPLQRQFPDAQVFDIAASASDLDLHIKNFLQHSPEVMALIEGTNLEEQIAETIHRKSGAMFLHAKLQLEALRNCVSALDVEETLQGFPNDIEAIYAKTWERILAQGSKQSSLAKLVLLWITHADGEMTIDTLRRAVATCPETYAFEARRMVPEALLLTVCCGLVSIDEKTRLVRLIHYTTRDAILPRLLDLYPVPHALLGHVCIVHVTKCGLQHYPSENINPGYLTFSKFNTMLLRDTLLEYAYRSWAHHTHQCGCHTPIISAAADLILNCIAYPLDWVERGGPLHVAAFYGFEDVILSAAQVHSPNSNTLPYNTPPLELAVKRGHLASAKALLSLPGIDVNLRSGILENTAFIVAAAYGHIEFMQLLAQAPGIDINVVDGDSETALISAAARGDTEVVKFLIRLSSICINTVDSDGASALMRAISEGHTQVVQELLSAQGIDVNHIYFISNEFRWNPFRSAPMKHWTALTMAASEGHINIVKQILKVPGINVNAAPDADGKTALSHAFAAGHRVIVDLLLAFPGTVVPHWIQNQMRAEA